MKIELERVKLLLEVASLTAQWPKLNGIAGLAGIELEEANAEALKTLEEMAKKKAEEEAKAKAQAAKAEGKKGDDDDDDEATDYVRRP